MDSAKELMKYRIAQAKECLESAIREENSGSYKTAANRSYYCIFHAMRAILALEKFDSKKHSGVISAFRERYIKTGILDMNLSKIIGKAFEVRTDSDYEDFYVVSQIQITEQIENAKLFLDAIEAYIESHHLTED